MFRLYFSLILFTLSFLFVGCFFNWDSNYLRLTSEILRSAGKEMSFYMHILKRNPEIASIDKHHEIPFGRGSNNTYTESSPEGKNGTQIQERVSEEILSPEINFALGARKKFFSTFGFPLNLDHRGFKLGMKLERGSISNKVRIIFMGRDLRNLLNIVIDGCRIYLFSKDEKNSSYLYDSSPLFLPKNNTESLQLIMSWSEKTFRLFEARPDNSLVALGSIVKTDSPLAGSGSAFIGDDILPLKIEWSFENLPIVAGFDCLINYFEQRCKSNSVRIGGTSELGFLGLRPDQGFLKIAFQFPPSERLPVTLRMMKDGDLEVEIQFFLDQMIIHSNRNSFKHFFLNNYQEGEWLNLDLVPISNLSLDYLTLVLKKVCSRKIFGFKGITSCFEINQKEDPPGEPIYNPHKNTCKNEFLQNIERSGKILSHGYGIQKNQQEGSFQQTPETSSKIFMAIDHEIIGNITSDKDYLNVFGLKSQSNLESLNSTQGPLGYWRLKAGLPKYMENLNPTLSQQSFNSSNKLYDNHQNSE
ncbi:hypothetical protein OJ253_66 [Cryptosporidium canis]|uniref:Lipoprotein n=1 Tax=Cryptosporidium canis TaxID=195482 RepID=A0A9D5DMS5_9CRYT|nr:hypothetical protein OJ253_66 [Cryptosporidium canis]